MFMPFQPSGKRYSSRSYRHSRYLAEEYGIKQWWGLIEKEEVVLNKYCYYD
jgi:hypothetical protein